jgi:hypothetical protein
MGSAPLSVAGSGIGPALLSLVTGSGSASHSYVTSDMLRAGPAAERNLADVLHFLCILHGRQPTLVDHAANGLVAGPGGAWLTDAVHAFAAERAFIARLAAAAGPVPSTPGAADSEGAVFNQHHALDMLGRSERSGCALGAALAMALDWNAIRSVLDVAATHFGVVMDPWTMGDADRARSVADAAASSPSIERALLFGAQQVAVQHFGLWDLLDARQGARASI